jgi:hypothetical protein
MRRDVDLQLRRPGRDGRLSREVPVLIRHAADRRGVSAGDLEVDLYPGLSAPAVRAGGADGEREGLTALDLRRVDGLD